MSRSFRTTIMSAALGALLAGSIGCQTYEVGQVLPSGWHMFDDVQYFPKGPQFPLSNELNAMQAAEAERTDQAPVYDANQ